MKTMIKIIFMVACLIAVPAMMNAQSSQNLKTKTGFMQNIPGFKQGNLAVNAANSTTTVHLHGKSLVYYWDSTSSKWIWNSVEYTKYDGTGRIIIDATTDTLGDSISKNITIYGANGSSYVMAYITNGTKLSISNIDSTIYDNNGNEIKYVVWVYSGGAWVLNQGNAYKITYNGKGNEVSSQTMDYSANTMKWANTQEGIFAYNADGSGNSDTGKRWNGSKWVNHLLNDSITWVSWNGKLGNSQISSLTEETWNGSAWVDSAHISYTYDGNGGSTITIQSWKANKWVNALMYALTYDSYGNQTGAKYETWDGSAWVIAEAGQNNITYDGSGNATEEIVQNYHTSSKQYVNIEKYVYSNFSSYTGMKEASNPNLQISLYPNPANETLHLKGGAAAPGNAIVTIYNMQGQAIFTEQTTNNELSSGINIPVNTLTKGIYILRAISGSGDINQEFIKN